ncbi:MAG TPA: YhcH/YjgK/YiaL family protein, partial [Clostridiales bacterium]|nr:YhcH/YjgK/YiaL family protein [Clostridiales bacterium]
MVLDKLTNLKAYSKLIPKTDEILAAIEKVRAGEFTGSRLDIDGDSIFLLNQEYETFDREGRQLEAHRKYIDLQAVIKGEEYIGWSEVEGLTLASEEYSKGGDIA